jgi:hypothetical protein
MGPGRGPWRDGAREGARDGEGPGRSSTMQRVLVAYNSKFLFLPNLAFMCNVPL